MNIRTQVEFKPHYLLALSIVQLMSEYGKPPAVLPDWVRESLELAPYVVVRRGMISGSLIPIGVRGQRREQRYAAFVHPDAIERIISPNDLLDLPRLAVGIGDTECGALSCLVALKHLWNGLDISWGPGGSTGFELATNIPTVTETSDLDIVIYADYPISIEDLRTLTNQLSTLSAMANIDVQIETGFCGFSLLEYCREFPNPILLKTASGALLGADPWLLSCNLYANRADSLKV